MIDEATVRASLARDWGLPDAEIVAHHGGMGSATWFVSLTGVAGPTENEKGLEDARRWLGRLDGVG
ncbi:MAG TPA: hypothetical protein VGC06_09530 [Actinomycetes bacterium]